MALDRDMLLFQGKAMSFADEEFAASFEGKGGEKFLDDLYAQYQAAGKPEVRSWLKNELAKHFFCMAEKPSWVGEEPAWPFFEGKPMGFIGQISLVENEVTKKHLTWDNVVYVFGARVPYRDGYRMEYRLVVQIRDLGGTGTR